VTNWLIAVPLTISQSLFSLDPARSLGLTSRSCRLSHRFGFVVPSDFAAVVLIVSLITCPIGKCRLTMIFRKL
jgi:hypothetical protein